MENCEEKSNRKTRNRFRMIPDVTGWLTQGKFNPLFPNTYNDEIENEFKNDNGRETIFRLNTELSQKLNSFVISYLKSISDDGEWLTIKLVPRGVIDKVNGRYYDEKEKEPKETYLDFIEDEIKINFYKD